MASLYEDADINFEQSELKHLLQKAEGLVGTEMLEMDKLLARLHVVLTKQLGLKVKKPKIQPAKKSQAVYRLSTGKKKREEEEEEPNKKVETQSSQEAEDNLGK
jgi:hypothetical protein